MTWSADVAFHLLYWLVICNRVEWTRVQEMCSSDDRNNKKQEGGRMGLGSEVISSKVYWQEEASGLMFLASVKPKWLKNKNQWVWSGFEYRKDFFFSPSPFIQLHFELTITHPFSDADDVLGIPQVKEWQQHLSENPKLSCNHCKWQSFVITTSPIRRLIP